MIVVGGVMPPQDYEALKQAGAEAIFPPGTVIADAAEALIKTLNARLGHAAPITAYRCPVVTGWTTIFGRRSSTSRA